MEPKFYWNVECRVVRHAYADPAIDLEVTPIGRKRYIGHLSLSKKATVAGIGNAGGMAKGNQGGSSHYEKRPLGSRATTAVKQYRPHLFKNAPIIRSKYQFQTKGAVCYRFEVFWSSRPIRTVHKQVQFDN